MNKCLTAEGLNRIASNAGVKLFFHDEDIAERLKYLARQEFGTRSVSPNLFNRFVQSVIDGCSINANNIGPNFLMAGHGDTEFSCIFMYFEHTEALYRLNISIAAGMYKKRPFKFVKECNKVATFLRGIKQNHKNYCITSTMTRAGRDLTNIFVPEIFVSELILKNHFGFTGQMQDGYFMYSCREEI